MTAKILTQELNFHCEKHSKAIYTRYYLSAKERRDLGRQAGDPGVLLYEYLLRMVSLGTQEINDETISDYFGWDIRKAKRHRLKLTKIGWYATRRYNISGNRRGISYYVGPEAVAKLGKPNESITRHSA